MKIMKFLCFISYLEVVLPGPCDPSQVVYAIFPGTSELHRATVVSLVVDDHMLVKWASNPQLCENTSNRVPCVVDATVAYNGKVCFFAVLPSESQGEFCASPTGKPTSSNVTHPSTVTPNGLPTQQSVYSPLVIIGFLSACFVGIPLAGVTLVYLADFLFPVQESCMSREELNAYMTQHEYCNPSDAHESNRNRILSYENA